MSMVSLVDQSNKQISIEKIKEWAEKLQSNDLRNKANALDKYIKSKQIILDTVETIMLDIDRAKLHYVQIDDKRGAVDTVHTIVIPYFIDTIAQLNQLLQSYVNGEVIIQQINPVSISRWACDKLNETNALKTYGIDHKISTLDLTDLQLKDDYDNVNNETCIDQSQNSLFYSLEDKSDFDIKQLKINDDTIRNRTNIEYLFQYLSVNEIDFGNADLDRYDSWEGLFYESTMRSLDLTKFKGNKVRQLKWAFKDQAFVEKLDLQTLYFDSLRDMDEAFSGIKLRSSSLQLHRHNIEIIRQNKKLYDPEPDFCMYQTFYEAGIKTLDLTDFSLYLVRDLDSTFSCCEINEIKFGHQELPFISSLQNCFSDVTIQKVDIENLIVPYATVTSMQSMFQSAEIPEVVLSKINTDGLTNMESFLYQAWIKTFDMRNIDTSNVTVMKSIFECCRFQIIVTDGRTLGFKNIEAYKKATVSELNYIVKRKYGIDINDAQTRICYAQLDTSKVQDMMQFVGSLTYVWSALKVFDFSYNNIDSVTLNWNFIDMKEDHYSRMITFKVRNVNGKVRYTDSYSSDREWQRIDSKFKDKDNSKDIEISDNVEAMLLKRA